MPADDVTWLELLAAEAGDEERRALRERLLAQGDDAAAVARDERAAQVVAGLLRERRRRVSELSALNDVAQQLATVPDVTELLQGVVQEARRLLGVDLTYLALLEGAALRIVVATGQRSPALVGVRLPADAGLIGRVAGSGLPMWTPDYVGEQRIVHQADADAAASAEGLRGLLGVPLTVRGRVIGALLAAKRSERHFTDDEIALLQALAGHAAVAIDNARAREELAASNAALQRALLLDEQLTAVVLAGGDLAAILDTVAEVLREATGAALVWVPAGERPGREQGATEVAVVLAAEGDDPTAVEREGVLAQPVLAAQRRLGVLAAAVAGPQERAGVALVLERAAPVVALTIAAAQQAARASELGRDIAVIDLVSRRESDARADRERLRGAGLDPRAVHDVVVVLDPDAVPALRRRVGGLRAVPGATYRGQAVLLVPHGPGWPADWPADGPVAGLAGPVPPGHGFREAYVDASRTARALGALGREAGLARSDELGVFGILLSHTGPRELAAQVRRELGPLEAEEERRGVPLVATLSAYLEHGRRPAATATALQVHVNTLYQRLAAVDRVLGEGWRDRSLELQVLLRVHEAAGRLGD